MKKKYILNLIIIFLFLIFVIWKFIDSNKKANTLSNKLSQEYELLTTDNYIENLGVKTYFWGIVKITHKY